jgi:hypothetical protein
VLTVLISNSQTTTTTTTTATTARPYENTEKKPEMGSFLYRTLTFWSYYKTLFSSLLTCHHSLTHSLTFVNNLELLLGGKRL